jgi:hypothetical protein
LPQVLQCCSDAVLHKHWKECAALAALRFDWRDQAEPLAAAQAAAHTLHYYPPSQVGVLHCMTRHSTAQHSIDKVHPAANGCWVGHRLFGCARSVFAPRICQPILCCTR